MRTDSTRKESKPRKTAAQAGAKAAAKKATRTVKPRPAGDSAAPTTPKLPPELLGAIAAAEDKKAENITVLALDPNSGGFTDFFVICTGNNPRQIQAISDGVEEKLSKAGSRPAHVEGYEKAEWVLLDYVDFVVHVFSPKSRDFYDLERLWKSATRLETDALKPKARARNTAASSRSRTRAPKAQP